MLVLSTAQDLATTTSEGNRLQGIICVLIAVSLGGASDGISKLLVEHHHFGVIMVARYLPTMLFLLVFQGGLLGGKLFRTNASRMQLLRGLMPFLIGSLMVVASFYLPLAEATVVLFSGPFLVVALSGLMLGERVTSASWIGVTMGFAAVVVVARPGFTSLSLYMALPAAAAVFFAIFQLLSRRLAASGENPLTTLAWTVLVGTVISIPLAIAQWRTPSLVECVYMLGLGIAFGISHVFFARAFALAPANVLTSYTYFQIIVAVLFGLIAFADVPDIWTIAGIVIMVLAGIVVFGVQRRG